MDSVSLSWEVLSGLLGKTTVELQSALTIDGNDGKKIPIDQSNIDRFVADALRARLSDQKNTGKDIFISNGKASAFDEVEAFINETYGLPKGTKWKDGISSVITEAKTKAATSEEVIKASEPYKAMLQKLQEEELSHTNTKKGFRDYKVNETLERQLNEVLSDENLGLALPDDKTIRGNQLRQFRKHLAEVAKLEPDENGSIIPRDEKGKPLEDANFLPLSLRSFITDNAKTFWPTKSAQATRTPPPAGDPAGNGATAAPPAGIAYPKFKDAQELSNFTDKAILEGKDVAFVTGALAAYESQPK